VVYNPTMSFINNKHIAAIDIGSNAVRLAISRQKRGQWTQCLRLREAVRLGSDVFETSSIGRQIEKDLTTALLMFGNQMENHNVSIYRAVATSAMREAKNSAEVCQRIAEKTGITVEVISGKEEASLVFFALSKEMDLDSGPHLIIDIGGGSVELIATDLGQILKKESFPLGTVRLLNTQQTKTEAMNHWLPLHLETVTKAFFVDLPPMKTSVGSGGNMDRFSKIMASDDGRTPLSLSYNTICSLRDRIIKTPKNERILEFQIRKDRADVIEPAAIVTETLMKLSGSQDIALPQVGLKEGILGKLAQSVSNN